MWVAGDAWMAGGVWLVVVGDEGECEWWTEWWLLGMKGKTFLFLSNVSYLDVSVGEERVGQKRQ